MHYRFHPLFGKELEVVHRRDSRSADERIAQLPDGTCCILPEWMFDESYCLSLQEVDRPVISVSALNELADLLASQDLVVRSSAHDSDTPPRTRCDSARPDRGTETALASNGERGVGSAKHSKPVRRATRRTAGRPAQGPSQRRTR